MSLRRIALALSLSLGLLLTARDVTAADKLQPAKKNPRNAIIFIADGLRFGSVNSTDAPSMLAMRERGVVFVNSHSLYPAFTMPNGSAIATGHYLGDTGTFGNTLYSGYPIFNTGNFKKTQGTVTPFIEDDQILADQDSHYRGNYLNEATLLAIARQNGYATAAVGKLGPTALQDVAQLNPVEQQFSVPQTVIIDDRSGSPTGLPLPADIVAALKAANMSTTTTARNQPAGDNVTPGTRNANVGQQQYFADAVTKGILPAFVKSGKPFVLVYWSRDPDGSQHNQGDSLNTLTPGINGPTSRAAVKNADDNLAQILAFINSDPKLAANTDVFLTSDHGFATISKHEIDAGGQHFTASYAAQFTYKNSVGAPEVNPGFLPPGFLAIDLAHGLNLPLFDPDKEIQDSAGKKTYQPVDPKIPQPTAAVSQRPSSGDGLLGGTGRVADATDAEVIVAANGGSDLIYVPGHNAARVQQIVRILGQQDYVAGIFVEDSYGQIPGALPFSAIRLIGAAQLPRPAVVVNFKTFYLKPGDLQSAVQIADTTLQEGQGMHGTLSRDNTFNNMAAVGPDFKSRFVDHAPVSNADIVRTIAHVLGLELPEKGKLTGRVLTEALAGGPGTVHSKSEKIASEPEANGNRTVLLYQQIGGRRYFDEACFTATGTGAANPCR